MLSYVSLTSATVASIPASADLYFKLYFLSAVANGFITPTSNPFLFILHAIAAAIVVFPTHVSVPVIKNPFCSKTIVYYFLQPGFIWIGFTASR